MELPVTLGVALELIQALERLQIPYFVGGSLASSIHGIPRSTEDADLVADLQPHHAQPLVAALEQSFYIDAERVMQAIRRRTSFNAIHLKSGIKVDVFVLRGDSQSRQEMARSRRITPFPDQDATLPIASPEDIILEKLSWYRRGGEVSDRQWDDVLGVLKVQRKKLDLAYLRDWAERTKVDDLLARAFKDAGIESDAE